MEKLDYPADPHPPIKLVDKYKQIVADKYEPQLIISEKDALRASKDIHIVKQYVLTKIEEAARKKETYVGFWMKGVVSDIPFFTKLFRVRISDALLLAIKNYLDEEGFITKIHYNNMHRQFWLFISWR